MSIITNRELRDLWADAAKIKEAISGGKVAVADAAVLAKLEAMRVLLAGTLSTADAAVLAKLADLESKLDMILNGTTPAAVELKGHLEALVAKDNATSAKQDSMIAALGAQSDAEATSDGSIVGLLKRLRTLIGDSLVTLGSAIGSKAQLIAGSDGTNARALKTAADGTLLTQLTGSKVEITPAGLVGTTIPAGTTFKSAIVDITEFKSIWAIFAMSASVKGKVEAEMVPPSSYGSFLDGKLLTLVDASSTGDLGIQNYPKTINEPLIIPSTRMRIRITNNGTSDITVLKFYLFGNRW